MVILYEDEAIKVGLTLFKKRTYVTDKVSRQTVYPPTDLINQLFDCTQIMTRARITDAERALLGRYLMHRFAGAALAPQGLEAQMFRTGDPARVVEIGITASRLV